MSAFPELIAFDMDGTLLRSDGSLSPRVRQAVREMKNQGCTIALATGRPWKAVTDTVSVLGVVDYCCLLYTSPSPRDRTRSRMPSSA